MSISYRFQEVKQSSSVKVECPRCGKSRNLIVSRSYYRNGFHDESATREKNRTEINREVEHLQRDGKICKACGAANNNVPILKKIDKDSFEVIDRISGESIGKIVRYKQCGWPNWECIGIKRKGPRVSRVLTATRAEAVDYFRRLDYWRLELIPIPSDNV